MYDKSDPRASLAPASSSQSAPPAVYVGAELGLFYENAPQITDALSKTWITRGQNLIIAYTEGDAGTALPRASQPDEYAVIIPDKEMSIEITTAGGTQTVPGYSIAFVPPGASAIKLSKKGRIVRIFSPKSKDLAAAASNAANFADTHPIVPPFKPWPEPPGGLKLKWYSLDVPQQPGRFGRIFRCTTIMINYLEPRTGARDRSKMSPHAHDDFEQCSLALNGAFTHHMRWPWVPDMNIWREDEHAYCKSPSICVIPPPSVHTTTSEDPGVNQLVDIFAPPRMDFSLKPGWVLNEKDYPMPSN